jgi:FixJ family two-component response regulator
MNKNNVRKVIYIVDDDSKLCESLSDILRDSGYKTSFFTDPMQCLKALRFKLCDLLITDYRMPGVNGIEFMQQAKNMFPWLPVVIITGYGNIQTAVTALKEGAAHFIEKPLEKESFLRLIDEILQEKASQAEYTLTNMEKKILKLIHEGNNNKKCAQMLNRSRRTVETHRANLMRKFDVNNVVDLIKKSSVIYNIHNEEFPSPAPTVSLREAKRGEGLSDNEQSSK